MKYLCALVLTVFTAATVARADDFTAKITNVHLCCNSCVKGVEQAASKVDGAKVTADKDSSTVTITAPDKQTAQKAASAIVKAGFFGESTDVKINNRTGAKGETVQTLKISGVHLCCGKCVKAVDTALKSVTGVTGDTAEKNATSFEVTGSFNDKDVFAALHKAGFSGKISK